RRAHARSSIRSRSGSAWCWVVTSCGGRHAGPPRACRRRAASARPRHAPAHRVPLRKTVSSPRTNAARRDTGGPGAAPAGLGARRRGAAASWLGEVRAADGGRRWGTALVALCRAHTPPPLYFVLAKAARDLLGDSAWALRLPSALLGAAAIPLVAAAAGTLADRRAARCAAWFAALSPFLVQHGQEARMYALVGTLAAANLLALARFRAGRSERLGVVFAVTALALAGTHYYAVFYLGGAVLAAIAARPRELRAWMPAAGVASLGSTAALLAAALVARHQGGGTYELGWFAVPGALWSLVSGYTLLPDTFALHA